MEGSRVYADLMLQPGTAKFILKNVSDQQLNISADELTERFIRGDVSRSTEGSGLGLSIAKNLTELQGGTFELYLDGDLFKVLITFPKSETVDQRKRDKKGKDRKSATGRRHRSDRRTSEEHEDRRYAGGAVADHESDIGIRYKIRKSLDLGEGISISSPCVLTEFALQ
ncbi:MAG: ATP-binding protein [Sellimonas intestinalis]